jgi:hypothetical protein
VQHDVAQRRHRNGKRDHPEDQPNGASNRHKTTFPTDPATKARFGLRKA